MPLKNTNYALQFICQLFFQLFHFLKTSLIMTSMTNHVQIIGHLGRDPEIKSYESGKKSARFSVAAREAYINDEGKRVETTEWVNIAAWNGIANIAEKYLHKGKQVAIAGKIHTREYTDAKGERKWITEVIATDLLLLGGTRKEEEAA
jgi:single-strand DNA-binding protein